MDRKRLPSFPLRLSPSIRRRADEMANRELISLNHFVSLAITEKIIRMTPETATEAAKLFDAKNSRREDN